MEIDWPAGAADGGSDGPELSREAMKLLLNLVVLGLESLPRGGRLGVALDHSSGCEITVSAAGEGAALREESAGAIAGEIDLEALTARSVQGYFVSYLAKALGGAPDVGASAPDTLTLRVRLPG